MKNYIVLHRIESEMNPFDAPLGFRCTAEDSDHAEEQCLNAYPDCGVVWIIEGSDYSQALSEYWAENTVLEN